MNPHTTPTVVVAVDLSPSGRAALAWAADYARAAPAELQAVHVLSGDVAVPVTMAIGLLGTPEAVRERIRTELRALFEDVRPEPSWSLSFVDGSAGHEIVGLAEHARLLVVGAREHRGVGRLLVGSVSHYCLTHARCPVVAVPPGREETEGDLVAAGVTGPADRPFA